MGSIKSEGRIYQQTFIDTYTKVAFVTVYGWKNALVAADMLNDNVLLFFSEHQLPSFASLPREAPSSVAPEGIKSMNVAWSWKTSADQWHL